MNSGHAPTCPRALTRVHDNGARVFAARTQTDLAAVLLDRAAPGDEPRGHELLDQAHAIARELGLAHIKARSAALLATRLAV